MQAIMNADEIADRRTALHSHHRSQRILVPGHDRIAMIGEKAFEAWSGIPLDSTDRPGGDKGRDFELPLKDGTFATVDVKTATRPHRLLVEASRLNQGHLYVLCERYTGKLVGWAYGTEVAEYPPHDTGCGVINHEVPRSRLRPMTELDSMRIAA